MSIYTRKKVLFFYTKPTTFVRRDIEMLQKHFHVASFSFYHPRKWLTPLLFIKQLFFILKHQRKAKLAFCMFAGYHSLLPAMFNKLVKKPFVIILGGTESVSIPSIGYGILHRIPIGKFAQWSYALTSTFVPVHSSLIYYENHFYEEVGKFQGLKHYFPSLKSDFIVIPNGYDPNVFKRAKVERYSNSFITAAFDLHKPHLYLLKGADLIISVANDFPECRFTIVGLDPRKNLKQIPANVFLVPPLNQEQLITELSKHEFYFQLSLSEGFPNTLCEAMLCNCIPVVSGVSSMPEIIGDTGFVLKRRDASLLTALLRDKVLPSNKGKRSLQVRERIIKHYHLKYRSESFIKLVNKMT